MTTTIENQMWIRQIEAYGLGNTIAMMPGLRAMSERLGKRIPMYFETPGLGRLFADCPFIDVMPAKLRHFETYTSVKPLRQPGETDYEAWHRILGDTLETKSLTSYVDKCSPPPWWRISSKTPQVAVFHGCLSSDPVSIARKDVGSAIVNALGHTTLREAVGIIQSCAMFISNPTGLYHAAAASGIPGVVLWKEISDCNKNRAPSGKVVHAFGDWGIVYRDMLKEVVS